MANLSDLTKLKTDADNYRAQAERAAGALEQTMVRLKKEFGCDNTKDAKIMLEKITREAEAAEIKFNESLVRFNKDWSND